MTLALTPAEAQAKIQQIEAARDQAIAKIKQVQNTQEDMLARNWGGGSAGTYGTKAAAQIEDLNGVIKDLDGLVTTATQHIHGITNMDNS